MESTFVVEGMLVGGNEELLKVVVTPYLMAFERAAVTDLEALPDPPSLVAGTGRAVRLHVRVGARILGLWSAEAIEATMWKRRSSFAVATRTAPPEETQLTDVHRARTRAFYERHGLEIDEEEIAR